MSNKAEPAEAKITVEKRDYPLKRNNKYFINFNEQELILPSVTTILSGALPKPQLLYWAAKVVGEYALEHPEASLEECKAQMNITKNLAADKGKTVHAWAEAYGNGNPLDPENMDEEIKGYGKAFVAFMEEVQPKILHTEVVVFNKTHGYAGTADQIGYTRDGKLAIFDYKTGKGVYFEGHLQQEAYANAEYIYTKEKEVLEMPKIEAKFLVHLKPNGKYTLVSVDEPFESFLAVKKVYEILQEAE